MYILLQKLIRYDLVLVCVGVLGFKYDVNDLAEDFECYLSWCFRWQLLLICTVLILGSLPIHLNRRRILIVVLFGDSLNDSTACVFRQFLLRLCPLLKWIGLIHRSRQILQLAHVDKSEHRHRFLLTLLLRWCPLLLWLLFLLLVNLLVAVWVVESVPFLALAVGVAIGGDGSEEGIG